MPDVVSDAATLSLRQMEDFMDDEHPVHGVDHMLSHHLLSGGHSPSHTSHLGHHNNNHNHHHNHNTNHQHQHASDGTNGMHHHSDPLLSSHHHNVDISHCIDPMLANNILGSPTHRSSHHDVLQSDNDSLVSDMDLAWQPSSLIFCSTSKHLWCRYTRLFYKYINGFRMLWTEMCQPFQFFSAILIRKEKTYTLIEVIIGCIRENQKNIVSGFSLDPTHLYREVLFCVFLFNFLAM